MSKPEKTRASRAALFINGLQIKGAQNLRVGTDITREEIRELANAGIAQYVETTPVVPITLDSNVCGSVDTLLAVVGNNCPWAETGTADSRRTGAYLQSLSTPNCANFSIDQNDLAESYCDITYTLSNDTDTSVARTTWVHKAALTGMTMSFSIGGPATESYTLTADNKTIYFDAWKSARVFPIKDNQVASNDGVDQQFFRVSNHIPTGASVIGLAIDDSIYRVGVSGVTASAIEDYGNTKTFSVTGIDSAKGFATSDGTDQVFVVIKATASPWTSYQLTSDSQTWRAITKAYCKAYLFNTAGPVGETSSAAGTSLRLQSVDVDVSMTSDNLEELGNYRNYGVIRNTPITVNVTVTANDTDLELWARACATTDAASGPNQLYPEMFGPSNYLLIKLFNHKTSLSDTYLLDTIMIDSMEVTSENFNIGVGGIGAQEFSFTADNIKFVGSSTDPVKP